jgi:hypothetical protein
MQPLEHKPISEIAAEEKRRAEQELEASKQPEPGSCACPKREPVQSEKDVYSSIAFENALHNQVYVKRGNNRRRREAPITRTSFMLEATRLKRELNSYQARFFLFFFTFYLTFYLSQSLRLINPLVLLFCLFFFFFW